MSQDNNIRPLTFDDFTGQAPIVKHMQVYIDGAKRRDEPLDHTIFYGPPGLGKTTLSNIIANELGSGFKATSAPIISRAQDVAAILTSLKPYDVLFIDEIHRLTIQVEEMLYSAMEDYYIDLMVGEGASARTVRINLPPFTLVGATTRMGLISAPLRDRFGIPEKLQYYSPKELQHVIIRAASKLEINITPDACLELAQRSRGTPRIALRYLRRIRDHAYLERITKPKAHNILTELGVDSAGLDASDIKYLRFIYDNYRNASVGVETIAAALSEKRDAIEEMIEPFLLQQGFIRRTSKGRQITESAIIHLEMDYELLGTSELGDNQPTGERQ